MKHRSLTHLTDHQLFSNLKRLRRGSCHITAEEILHLAELDNRGTYREAGFASLFSYCREELGHSEPSANRRVRAARAIKGNPEIYDLVKSGKLTLSALSEVYPVITPDNGSSILAITAGKSKHEAERIAAHFGAPKKARREVIKPIKVAVFNSTEASLFSAPSVPAPVVEERFHFSFEVSQEVNELFEKVCLEMGRKKAAEVFEKLLRDYMKRMAPKIEKAKVQNVRGKIPANREAPKSRAIPKRTKLIVKERDNCQCSYVSPEGKRCSERAHLQFDHIIPFANGGTHAPENLRLRCFAHNQLYSEQCFGREYMDQFKRRSNSRYAGVVEKGK